MNILKIQAMFLAEAQKSPVLLSDLASMEGYIAESYQGRSLIELLQNADDAGSTKFLLRKVSPHVYIAANNGRCFSEQDVYSICRSGSSTKARGGNTIGYRGIGFKSVVNYSKAVHIASGDVELTFSRTLSEAVFESGSYKVPLIRIPHQFSGGVFVREITDCKEDGYTTVFVFETTSAELEREVAAFQDTSLLFLSRIESLVFEVGREKQKFLVDRSDNAEWMRIALQSNSLKKNWLTFRDPEGTKAALAFLLNESNVAVPLERDDAVVHSFMPTQERFRFGFKINGDFSTDPSRTRVVVDKASIDAATRCALISFKLLLSVIEGSIKDDFCVVPILREIRADAVANLRAKNIGDIFCEAFLAEVARLPSSLGFDAEKEIVLQPAWMNCIDFQDVCLQNGFCGLGESNVRGFVELEKLLISGGLKPLSLDAVLDSCAMQLLSIDTRLGVVKELVRKYRFRMTPEVIASVRKAKIFDMEDGTVRALEGIKFPVVSAEFISKISAAISDEKDLGWLLERIGLKTSVAKMDMTKSIRDEKKSEAAADAANTSMVEDDSRKVVVFSAYSFKKKSSFKKWRSVEENVEAFFGELGSVNRVLDVSKSNLGYDLEVQWDDKVQYVEVKSVDDLGDPISLTNNEYSTAARHGDSYVLAIAQQDAHSIKICLIKDPVGKMDLIKRVTRWEWVCNEYEGEVFERAIGDDY